MYSIVNSGGLHGVTSFMVRVETDVSNGLPCMEMVGLLASEVKEAKERVRVALKNSGFPLPASHITVNLSPADIRKEGNAYDLPIALSILQSMQQLPEQCAEQFLVVGEVSLNGELRAVRGILPMVMEALKNGIRKCVVPKQNVKEAGVLSDMRVFGASTLGEAVDFFKKSEEEQLILYEKPEVKDDEKAAETAGVPDFSEVDGQEGAKRAAEIAAAGFHHLLLIGPPGAGKTMIASRLPGILPPLSGQESLEVTAIHSVAGKLLKRGGLIKNRPFLSPHHTMTAASLTGGGNSLRPGVISLAHRGVLFLDEMTEMRRSTLDVLRQPLEEKKVQISRNTGIVEYPADFLLVGALNPCPCGYYPDRNRCRCTESEVRKYIGRISGPILDRMDLVTRVENLEITRLIKGGKGNESSAQIRERVLRDREIQEKRFAGEEISFNAAMGVKEVHKYCRLSAKTEESMTQAFRRLNMSARGYHKVLRVARTIADLEGAEEIGMEHIGEALLYRRAEAE